jgi:hypothetical protein
VTGAEARSPIGIREGTGVNTAYNCAVEEVKSVNHEIEAVPLGEGEAASQAEVQSPVVGQIVGVTG